ncbi:hypothetical protein KC19_8G137000 [Ceratodon purpureus]|uniref:Secreted protein n=1 Tax=Ceratodon purpureus TaxID=3225 RepID=A0A8T0H334_CERPU|nr:hypothetical protein KC19_8G137000 [Ceratodon purpureus]
MGLRLVLIAWLILEFSLKDGKFRLCIKPGDVFCCNVCCFVCCFVCLSVLKGRVIVLCNGGITSGLELSPKMLHAARSPAHDLASTEAGISPSLADTTWSALNSGVPKVPA